MNTSEQYNLSKWYELGGPAEDIVVSSRVRLARNIAALPFPGRMSRAQEKQMLEQVSATLTTSAGGGEFRLIELGEDNRLEAQALMERRLISPEFASSGNIHGLVLSRDESLSIMVCEEDHLRIQALAPGLQLERCLDKAERIDDLLDEKLEYAYDERLGYLTRCPTNLGTGMRASVMLHLPALTGSGAIQKLAGAAGKLGLAVRGIYGEGSQAEGALYQISNQLTLGLSEREVIQRLSETVASIIGQERALRAQLWQQRPGEMADRVWRAKGLLTSARKMDASEAMALLGDLRLGVAQSEEGLSQLPLARLNTLLYEIGPASLAVAAGKNLTQSERDSRRAAHLRAVLGGQ